MTQTYSQVFLQLRDHFTFVSLLTWPLNGSEIVGDLVLLKGPSQPPPFSMPSKLFTLLGAAKSYCISVSCVPEGMFDDL